MRVSPAPPTPEEHVETTIGNVAPRIVLAGGSGELGRLIAAEVQRRIPGAHLIIGDHRRERGRQTAARLGTDSTYLDAEDRPSLQAALAGADLVLVAVSQARPLIQQVCAELGIPCADVTVDPALIGQVQELDRQLLATGTTSVVMTGLFPGLSGLLARRAVQDLEHVTGVDVALLQHTNARAGRTGVVDMLRLICAPVPTSTGTVPGFRRRFGGARWLRGVDSAERAGLQRALGTGRLDYWTGWNDRDFTAMVAALVRLRVLPGLAPHLARLRRHRPASPEPVELRVRAAGLRGGAPARVGWSLRGDSDYGLTAITAAAIAHSLLGPTPPGVHTPGTLTTLDQVLPPGAGGAHLRRIHGMNSRSR